MCILSVAITVWICIKNSKGNELYKDITMTFNRQVLRDF